jgi:hypothetical protein
MNVGYNIATETGVRHRLLNFIAVPRSAKQTNQNKTNTLEHNPSLQADSCQSTQKIPSNVHTNAPSPPKVPVMSQIYPIHALTYNLTVPYNPRLGLLSDHLSLSVPTKTLSAFLFPMRAIRLAQYSLRYFITLMISDKRKS